MPKTRDTATGPSSSASPDAAPSVAAAAERRHATVLFADLAGFTAFSERAGEEASFTLMQDLAALMTDVVHAQGGTVKSFTGDGVMALFGAPTALEDAPLRACRAALEIQERIKATSAEIERKHGLRPQLRVGVNTGAVVIAGPKRRRRRRHRSWRRRQPRLPAAGAMRAGGGAAE
jgi:class 3 adenylate cyclase